MKNRHDAIKHALNGLVWGLQTQPNYKIHIFFTVITLLFAYILRVSYTEWLILTVTIILGFVIETINTAIEKIGDAIDTNYNEHIKHAKDSSAGAMLLFSAGAVVLASVIFIPKIIKLIT